MFESHRAHPAPRGPVFHTFTHQKKGASLVSGTGLMICVFFVFSTLFLLQQRKYRCSSFHVRHAGQDFSGIPAIPAGLPDDAVGIVLTSRGNAHQRKISQGIFFKPA